ncbi:unnamed protein product [Rotaria sp. Silwood2]|nr:unnamed protein product [Rotaria sp. Silwood2]
MPYFLDFSIIRMQKFLSSIYKKVIFLYQTRFFRCILVLLILTVIIYSIWKSTFISTYEHEDDVNIYEFVPDFYRRFVLNSCKTYTVTDLINITKLSNNNKNDTLNSAENPIHLISQWYYETNIRRRKELISVLYMNVINDAISKIHFIQNSKSCTVFNDIKIDKYFPTDILRSKLIIYYDENFNSNQRLTTNQALQYANHFITTGYTILLNLDIFFDQSLAILKHRTLFDKKIIFYLSRYEVDLSFTTGVKCSNEYYKGSHDALIFQTPIPNDVIEKLPFEMGTWFLEEKIIHELTQANYTVRNPCKSIRIWHVHLSQVRHRLMPAKKYLTPELRRQALRYPEFL